MAIRRAWPAVLLLLVGCHHVKTPVSVVHMGDPATANQLISGFYAIEGEGDKWRWAGSDFLVALAPPPDVRQGARLLLQLYFPETQMQKLGPITLTASIDGKPLPPETYDKAGSYDFVRDIPACLLDTNLLPVKFSFDRYSPHSDTEGRDLGAVVLMAALQPK
jgi:hypothetical protein